MERMITMVGPKNSMTRVSLVSVFQFGSSNRKHNEEPGERREVSRIQFPSNIHRPRST